MNEVMLRKSKIYNKSREQDQQWFYFDPGICFPNSCLLEPGDIIFNSMADNMIKLSVDKTYWPFWNYDLRFYSLDWLF